MKDVYSICPQFENEKYLLRLVSEKDCLDLLKVYSDEKAVPFFNSDNCHGDTFYYTTESRMKEAVDFWLLEYSGKGFVRWVIIDKFKDEAIGTIELFQRIADDYFTECGLLRLDVRSDYETADEIQNILFLIVSPAFELFHCNMIATKAKTDAKERRIALGKIGFCETSEKLIGHDGAEYDSYFILNAYVK